MKYLENANVAATIAGAPKYQKSEKTGLRNPVAEEMFRPFTTYVKDGDGVRAESKNTVTGNDVIGRNPDPIGTGPNGPIYNEWLIPRDVAVKNYGAEAIESLTGEFSNHRKSSLIRATKLTQATLDELGVSGDILEITVDWSPEPMKAKLGDYLTDGGYSISAHDMATTYTPAPGESATLTKVAEQHQRAEQAKAKTEATAKSTLQA